MRNFLHCFDAASAFDMILHKGVTGQVYNISGSQDRTIVEIAQELIEIIVRNNSKTKEEGPERSLDLDLSMDTERSLDPELSITYVADRNHNDMRYFY